MKRRSRGKIWRVTYLLDGEYCRLKPSDDDCQVSVNVYATSKFDAVWKFHKMTTRVELDTRNNRLPYIWSVEAVA